MRIEYSFIIPVYNCCDYIDSCIESIVKQKKKCLYEIIIVDDGSTDLLESKIKKFENEYLNIIKYYKKEHEGISIARNFGIDKSNGEYIVFVDVDDKLYEEFFINCEKLTKNSFYDVIKTRVMCEENKKYDGRFELPIFDTPLSGEEAITTFCNSSNIFATPWSYIIKRKYIIDKKLYFKENTVHEDYGLIPLIIANASTVISVSWYGYRYIKRKDSLSMLNDDSRELLRISDFIEHTKNLMQYFYVNLSSDSKKQVCKYFYERLKIKIGNLNYSVKRQLNYDALNEITSIYNEVMQEIKYNNLNGNYGRVIDSVLKNGKNIFNDNLVCIVLGGSCGKNDNIIGWSDIDLYIILKEYDITMVREFSLIIDNYDIHVGTTYYTLFEIENKIIDNKTKVTLYEKNMLHFNPTLYGFCNFPKVDYNEIVQSDTNNLPNVMHEFRRMFTNALNKKIKVDKKYVKKLLVLLKCYLNTKYIFVFGYELVVSQFLLLYNEKNKNDSTNEYCFDIIKVISNLEKYSEDIMNFSKIILKFIENEEMF